MKEPFEPELLGAMISDARLRHGLERNQLATLVEASPSQVTRWEQNVSVPSPEMLSRLARVLELRASTLFELADSPIPEDKSSLPAMLRSEYDLPPKLVATIEARIIDIADKYREQQSRK